METEQLPQQQLKMHHQKGFFLQGSKELSSRSSVPSPVQPPSSLGCVLGGGGCCDFLLHLEKWTKEDIWRAWKPVWVLETLGQSPL